MKHLLFSAFFTVLLSSCGASSNATLDANGDHYTADNCEIFVDKILTTQGSHYSAGVAVYVKTLNERLDSRIAEVGFRHKRTGRDMSGVVNDPWRNEKLIQHYGAANYWQFSHPTTHDWGTYSYEGSLYVRTTKGTTYWAKPSRGSDFLFDPKFAADLFNVTKKSAYDPKPEYAYPVQRSEFGYLNPKNCF